MTATKTGKRLSLMDKAKDIGEKIRSSAELIRKFKSGEPFIPYVIYTLNGSSNNLSKLQDAPQEDFDRPMHDDVNFGGSDTRLTTRFGRNKDYERKIDLA